MNAAVFRQALLITGVFALSISGSFAAEPLSEKESEKLIEQVTEPLEGFHGVVLTLGYSPDGQTLFGGGWGRTPTPRKGGVAVYVVWRTEDWERIRQTQDLPNRWPDPSGVPFYSAFLGSGHWFVTVTDTHQLKLFEEGTSQRARRPKWLLRKTVSLAKVYPEGRNGRICNAAVYGPMRISPDQRWLALPLYTYPLNGPANFQSAGLVELWKISSAERTAKTGPQFSHHLTIKIPDSKIYGMDFGTDSNTLVTATNDLSIRIWNPEDGDLKQKFEADEGLPKELKAAAMLNDPKHRKRDCTVDVSPDGKTLAIGFGRIVRLYDLEKNRWLTHHRLPKGFHYQNVVFHPSGRWLVSTNHTKLVLWSFPRLQPRVCVEVPKGDIAQHNVVFSPDGKLMVTGGYGPLRWDFAKLLKAANVRIRQ